MKILHRIPFLVLLLPMVAAILIYDHFHTLPTEQETKEGIYKIQITSVPDIQAKSIRFRGRILSEIDSTAHLNTNKNIICTAALDSLSITLQQGDILVASTRLTHANRHNPYEFDYDRYLHLQGISHTAYLATGHWLFVEHQTIWHPRAVAERCQARMVNIFRNLKIEGNELGVLSSLTLGERAALSPEIRRQFSSAGAMHILAVSGLHTGIVYGAIMLLLTGFGLWSQYYHQRKRRRINAVLIILTLWVYAFITGLSPSVVRASLMLSLFTLAALLDRQADRYNIICASAFITLAVSPESLFTASFQLSYTAVTGIAFFTPRLMNALPFRTRPMQWLWGIISCSIGAQAGTIPLTLWYFSQFSTWFILTNLIVIPLAGLIVYTAFATLLLSFSPLAALPASLLRWQLHALNLYVGWIEQLPSSALVFSLNVPLLISLLFALFGLVLWIKRPRWQSLIIIAISLGAFCFFHLTRLSEISHTDRLIVYNSPRNIVILAQQGRECTLLTDSTEAALRLTEPLRRHEMMYPPDIVNLSERNIYAWQYGKQEFLLLRNGVFIGQTLSQPVRTDIVLCGARGGNIPDEIGKIDASTWVSLPSMYARQADALKQTHTPCLDVREGAIFFYPEEKNTP